MHRFAAIPLLLTLPLIWRAGFALSVLALRDRPLAKVIAPGIALALSLLVVHVLGLVSHSFYVAIFVALPVLAVLGALSFLRVPFERDGARESFWLWGGMLLALAFLAGPEARFSEHDECLVSHHIAIPMQIQNGIYPPRHMTFPQFEFRYHYATDLLAAVASTLAGDADMQLSVHVLALLLWAYCFYLFWKLGQYFVGGKNGGRFAGPVTAFGVLFAGGAPWLCRDLHPLSLYLISDCAPGGTWITPPLISNFLQHPWSLGIPLFACFLFLFSRRAEAQGNPWWWTALCVVMALLSLSQVVLFVTLLPTAVAVGALDGWRPSFQRAWRFVLFGLAMAASARLLHGFFAPSLEPHGAGIEFHPYFTDASWRDFAAWNWDALGLLLPLGLLGLRYFRGDRLLLGTLALGSLLVCDLFQYAHSWDIVKFSMVSQLCFALLAAATLTRALQSRRTAPLGIAGFALCIAFGVAWPVPLALNLPDLWFCKDLAARPSPEDQRAIDYLRPRVKAGEAVYRKDNADAYAIYGGLPQPSWDWSVETFGFSQKLYDDRKQLTDNPIATPEPLLAQGFRWVVLTPSDEALSRAAEQWTHDGKAQLAAKLSERTVYRLTP